MISVKLGQLEGKVVCSVCSHACFVLCAVLNSYYVVMDFFLVDKPNVYSRVVPLLLQLACRLVFLFQGKFISL
jgi:hypothetical protein